VTYESPNVQYAASMGSARADVIPPNLIWHAWHSQHSSYQTHRTLGPGRAVKSFESVLLSQRTRLIFDLVHIKDHGRRLICEQDRYHGIF
jgi:hypothetical protein